MTDRTTSARGSAAAPAGRRIAPFLVVSALTLALCLMAGRLGPPGEATLALPAWLGGAALPAGRVVLLFPALLGLALAGVIFFPRGLSPLRATVAIVVLAAGARALLLPLPASDDVNRYLWEGRALAAGVSPYAHPPRTQDDPSADALRDPDDPIWAGINHPEMTAIYPPGMLLLLAGVASVAYDPIAVKVVMVAADLATLLLIVALLVERRDDPRWALLWALNPVPLFAFAAEGHNDAIQILLLTAALVLSRRRRWALMWLALGLAVQAKYVALLAWPFFLSREGWRWSWLALVVAFGPLIAFLALDGGSLFASFFAFGLDMAFNGPVHGALRAVTGSTRIAALACQGAFLLLYGIGLALLHPSRRWGPTRDPVAGMLTTFALFLALSPTVHFWYVAWILPLVALRPSAAWLTLSATIGVTFVTYGVERLTGAWSFPAWGPWAVWSLPLLLAAWEARRGLRRLSSRRAARKAGEGAPETATVLIPTRDEADRIEGCLAALARSETVAQVIVVDAGSTDDTRSLARARGAEVLLHDAPPERGGGRGGQIAAGLPEATGDVVVIVHADTIVPPGAIDDALAALTEDPEAIGGAIGASFEGPGPVLRLIEAANDLRASMLGIAFGDQVQFFRRCAIERFPALPLMEDVELSLRLGALGRRVFRWGDCRVSPRRWQRDRPLARILLVVGLTGEYLARRVLGPVDTTAMYRRYYGR